MTIRSRFAAMCDFSDGILLIRFWRFAAGVGEDESFSNAGDDISITDSRQHSTLEREGFYRYRKGQAGYRTP